MIKIKGPAKNPLGSKSGVGGAYTTGINPDPGGDTEMVESTPGRVRLTQRKTEQA
jgi:hypothetical protein